MPILEIENIHTYYGHIHALKDVSLVVEKGEIVTLIGANGAGKSTTLKTISGLLRPRQGAVRFSGEEITRYPPHEIVGKGVVQVPEGRRIFGRLTVLENLEMGAFLLSDRKRVQANLKQVFSLFPRLEERLHQQMLATGRALMSSPRLLLLDEPSMGLAPVLVDSIFDTIRKLHETGTTILLVEQNARMALQVADRGYVLQSGTILLSDSAEGLRQNETVRQAYLGESTG
jgi:branched-chain amino acid transport system ATP-binding protein